MFNKKSTIHSPARYCCFRELGSHEDKFIVASIKRRCGVGHVPNNLAPVVTA